MAKITLDGIRHSYTGNPVSEQDWALKRLDVVWSDGGAYALLGPSGCGKSTVLNVVAGLHRATSGGVVLDPWLGTVATAAHRPERIETWTPDVMPSRLRR